MSFTRRWFLIILGITVGWLAVKLYPLCKTKTLPVLDENAYWGPGSPPTTQDTSIRPFKISVSDEVINDLKRRLETDRPYTPPLENIQQQYGFNTVLLKDIVQYWRTKYNWREQEKNLNKFDQFKTKIQGLDIHYLHVKPKVSADTKVLPLLILHGWPVSNRELYGIIPFLTQKQKDHDFVFEVIAPSLPGFGFSEGASKPSLGPAQIAVIMKNLMERVGFEKYYVQGGDWGAVVVTQLATLFPNNVLGLHSSMCIVSTFKTYLKMLVGSLYPPFVVDKKYQHKIYPILDRLSDLMEESGYFHLQATKPDTVGVALGQSPSGLAAYMLEKFSTGTNLTFRERADAGLKERFTYDDLLDYVMIYWITNCFTHSSRIYANFVEKNAAKYDTVGFPISTEVPCACARMGQEIAYYTDWMLKDKYQNLVYSSDYDVGGHFAAMEVPEILANDIFMAVSVMRKSKTT